MGKPKLIRAPPMPLFHAAYKFIHTVYAYSLLMHCIKIKSPAKSLLNEQYVFVVDIFLFFVCYHVVPKRHSQLDYELNDL